jgi:hypothetical protein
LLEEVQVQIGQLLEVGVLEDIEILTILKVQAEVVLLKVLYHYIHLKLIQLQ